MDLQDGEIAKDIEPFMDPVFENNVILTRNGTSDHERQTKSTKVCPK